MGFEHTNAIPSMDVTNQSILGIAFIRFAHLCV